MVRARDQADLAQLGAYFTAFGFVRLGFGSFATLNSGGIMGDQMPCLSQM